MKDGSFIYGLFVAAIIIMLILFMSDTLHENREMKRLLEEQQETIDTQNHAIYMLRTLNGMKNGMYTQ